MLLKDERKLIAQGRLLQNSFMFSGTQTIFWCAEVTQKKKARVINLAT